MGFSATGKFDFEMIEKNSTMKIYWLCTLTWLNSPENPEKWNTWPWMISVGWWSGTGTCDQKNKKYGILHIAGFGAKIILFLGKNLSACMVGDCILITSCQHTFYPHMS